MDGSSRRARALGSALIILGGLHYGYNIAAVGSALQSIHLSFPDWPPATFDMLSGATLAGAILGSPLSGWFCEICGRRPGTLVGESLSVTGVLVTALTSSRILMTVGRFLLGVGVGFCTLAKPLFVRETLEARDAGVVLAFFAPAVALGIVAAQAVAAVLSREHHWRAQLALGAVPALALLLVAAACMPESDAWRARRAGGQASGATSASAPSSPSKAASATRAATYAPVVLAVLLALGNQLSGAFPVLIYADVLAATGSSTCPGADGGATGTAFASLAVVTSLANLAGAGVAVPLVAVCRRRLLVVGGLSAMTLLLLHTAWLERDAPSRAAMGLPLALTLAAWCVAYEVGPGAGYFVIVGDLASATPSLSAVVFACGNAARFGCEFALSFFFLSACGAYGLGPLLLFHVAVTAALTLLLLIALPETNPRFTSARMPALH